jgi:hypothetical protein
MLDGIARNPIIVGAYANEDGVCPMLAAHRNGGRTSLISFARAWDRFAFREVRKGSARRATERELRVLKTYLEASLLEDELPRTGLAGARREHLELRRRREQTAARDARRASDEARERRRRAREAARARATVRARRHESSRARPGDPDRSRELGPRPGWSWTRLFRRYDEYELALRRLETESTRTADPARAAEAAWDTERDLALTR